MAAALQASRDPQHRARFDAIRRKIFGEMGQAAARWRLSWLLPFNVFVLVLLVARGEPHWRAYVQGGALTLSMLLFVVKALPGKSALANVIAIFTGSLCYFTALTVTGGIASPLLPTGLLIVIGASVGIAEPKWLRPVFFVWFLAGFGALALLSRTWIGEIPPPLTPAMGWSTAEYVTVGLTSVAFTVVGIYRMGCTITRGYEQVAYELAERRDEICSENEDRTRALEGIAARLAHEVRNPLAAIKGLSAHMARTAGDPKTSERLAIVAAEADRLQSIVDGFLSFSRGFDDLKVAPTKPHELARELALLLETRASESGVSLAVRGDASIGVNADARKLRQALLNIVLNAIQASPRGGTVTIGIERGAKGVRLRVTDEGAGMTPEVLGRIRKPYFTTKEGGSGLGVAVARGLIEQHGGELKYESAPGKGTTVTIDLPSCAKKFCKMLPNPLRGNATEGVEAASGPDLPRESPAAR
jgi:signal transduction histidine kinase